MQLEERRDDPKRIDVARPLEVVGARGRAFEGYTRNLSTTGLRARFDGHCSVGANLLVRIALEEGAPPVEKRARVVWSAPDVYGEGMDVGLRLVPSHAAEEVEAEAEADPPHERAPLLAAGARVEVEYGGIALPAIVARIGEITDSGVVQVTLRLAEDAASAEDDSIVVEKAPVVERTLRYAAEARRIWLLHGAPFTWRAAAAAVVFARAAGRVSGRVAARLWAKLPPRIAGPIERTSARAHLLVRTVASRISAAVSHRIRVSRQEP